MSGNYIGVLGIAVLLGIALLLSTNRKAISLRVVGAAFALQASVAVFVLTTDTGVEWIEALSRGVQAVIDYSGAGINMVFGGLANEPVGFSFAVRVLPVIIFFSALMSVLYHIKIIQSLVKLVTIVLTWIFSATKSVTGNWPITILNKVAEFVDGQTDMQMIVKIFGGALRWILGTGPVESLNAAANVFVGQTEAPLVVKPYLSRLTEPQMFAVMVSGVASIAGTVLAGYVLMGAEMKYLLAASFMAAPGGLLMAKLIMPDDLETQGVDKKEKLVMEESKHVNVILAAAVGAADGLRLAVNIGAMLIAFVALIAVFDGVVGGIAGLLGFEGWTLQMILGEVFKPLMYVIGVPWPDATAAGTLFGEKIILNEFVAFLDLNTLLADASPKAVAIVTFSLCGFANLSSIAILLGGLGVLVPEKKELIAKFGLRAVAAGSLSNLMSATLAGLLLTF